MSGHKNKQPEKPAVSVARKQPEAARPQDRKPDAAKPAAKPAPAPQDGQDGKGGQDEQDTTDVRMVNATHGAAHPGDVITVDREEGAGIVAAGYGLPVTDGDEDDEDGEDERDEDDAD